MPRRVAEVGEGNKGGNGVYGIIRDLIVEGKYATFVNKKGRYIVNWSKALDRFFDYKAKKNRQFKSKAVSRKKISNSFRAALLNYYKKEGATEYMDARKVNEKDEVVERQFQMPPRLFGSMFRDVGSTVTEDSEEDDQEDPSRLVSSEGDDKPEVSRSTSTSDRGFDEFSYEMVEPPEGSSLSVAGNFLTDPGLDVINTEGEETSVRLSDVQLPTASQIFSPSIDHDAAIENICSDAISDDISDEGIGLLGVVHDILPTSGSIKGGIQFNIILTEELPDEVKTGVAEFQHVANVMVKKLNAFTLTGIVPPSQKPCEVAVTVHVVTDARKKLGTTLFRYIDEMREMVLQIVNDPTLQSLFFDMLWKELGFFGNDSNIAQDLGPIDLQGQVQTKQQQSVKVLQLLVYTAAQTDAREFIQMFFGTSAGQIVFNSYKDRTPLPEDVAQANGHEELAQYLTDINTRLSKETFEDVQSCAIDWLELVKAVQKQSSQDESTKGLEQPSDTDDTSDYFADVETSSCGSSDHVIMWTNMSENKAAWKCPRGSPILQVELSSTMSQFSSSTMVKELTIDETINIEMPESADTVPSMAQSHAVTCSIQGTCSAVSCMPCTDEETFNDVHPVGTTMSENGLSNKCPLKATNSDEKLKKAEESTQRPTTRPVVDKKGTPSKHEVHSCKQVPPMAQSHAVTSSVQGTNTAVSCTPCGHGCYRCQRCEKCSLCGNKDVLVNCLINRVAVCSKSCKSKTRYFNESDGQCCPCTECCGKDKMNTEPVPLERKEKDSRWGEGSSASSDGCASKVDLLLLHLPVLVKDFTWEVQNEFGKCLNPLKESGYDWRIVASRLQLTWIIQRLEQKLNPAVEMLGECTETTSKELLEILVDVRRTDVIDDMLKFFGKNARLLGPRHPTQESIAGDSSFDSSLSWPLLDSEKARYPRLLMELSVEVHRMRYDAYEMRPHRQLDRGVRLQINERTRTHGCQDGTRYSVEETNQFHGQAQEDERVGTFSLPRQRTVSRSSPAEPMLCLGQNSGGKYIWKIVGFSHHLEDARNGKITSLESSPIHTSQQEYKFSMHLFLNGVNGGDGSHFGLFVGMMQGEYDTVLEWPFGGRISLTIMGQTNDVNGCRHDISGTFMAKRGLRAFQKPTAAGPHNTLYGYAEFAPRDLVCSSPYLKDDTVMIQIEIHKNI